MESTAQKLMMRDSDLSDDNSRKPVRTYKDTPIVRTAERLPTPSDGSVLAREHGKPKWWRTRWSEVTRHRHTEWRKLEYTAEHLQRGKERARQSAAKRKAEKKQAMG